MTNDVHTDAPETIDALRTVLLLMDGDPDAVIAAAKQRYAESDARHPGSEIDTHCTGYVPFEI